MKRFVFALAVFAVAAGGFAQKGDARSWGMGNAVTGLADDINAIYFNPAGLAFLKKGVFVLGTDASLAFTNRLLAAINASQYGSWPSVSYTTTYDSNGDPVTSYKIWDSFLQNMVEFDPAQYGFSWVPDDIAKLGGGDSLAQAVAKYTEVQQAYMIYTTFRSLQDLYIQPRIAFAAKGWGFSTLFRYDIGFEAGTKNPEGDFVPGFSTNIAEMKYRLSVKNKTGAMGAFGFNLGGLAFGANLKLFNEGTYQRIYTAEDTQTNMTASFMKDIFLGKAEKSTVKYELGLGTMAVFGPFNVGAYLDNVLSFVDTSSGMDPASIFDSMSVGVSWTPFDNKLESARGILNCILTADFRNAGDDMNRQLAAGFELGLNLGNVIVANLRGGYNQAVPGTIDQALAQIDPELGYYTIGLGAKFLFATVDLAAVVPASVVFNPLSIGYVSSKELDALFGRLVLNVSLSF